MLSAWESFTVFRIFLTVFYIVYAQSCLINLLKCFASKLENLLLTSFSPSMIQSFWTEKSIKEEIKFLIG